MNPKKLSSHRVNKETNIIVEEVQLEVQIDLAEVIEIDPEVSMTETEETPTKMEAKITEVDLEAFTIETKDTPTKMETEMKLSQKVETEMINPEEIRKKIDKRMTEKHLKKLISHQAKKLLFRIHQNRN